MPPKMGVFNPLTCVCVLHFVLVLPARAGGKERKVHSFLLYFSNILHTVVLEIPSKISLNKALVILFLVPLWHLSLTRRENLYHLQNLKSILTRRRRRLETITKLRQ